MRSGTRWHLQAEIKDPAGSDDEFGEAVALSGNTAVISVPDSGNDSGAAYVYVRSRSKWHLQAKLTDPRDMSNDSYGVSVAVSGPTIIIGANGVRDDNGAAYVYVRSGTHWRLQKVLTRPSHVSGSGFGYSVAISGPQSAIRTVVGELTVSGLSTKPRQCGRVFEFTRSNRAWRKRSREIDPQCRSYDEFGYSLALSGSTAVIGAPGADNNAGVAYVATLP